MTGPQRIEKAGMGGRVFSITWVCPRCGGKVDKTDRYCRNCGSEMLSSTPPTGATHTRKG